MLKPLPPSARWFLLIGALNLTITIGLGAAGMHGLKAHLTANDPGGWFQTALHYHQIHSLGLLAIGLTILFTATTRWLVVSGLLLLVGMVLFSGNLYLRSIAGIHVFHAVTPMGGMAFILGWLMYAWSIWRARMPVSS